MERLRAEDGCPWDREQTSESLKTYLLEEAYELIDAINVNDPFSIREELGDILLQVVFHAQIWKEKNVFTIVEVLDTLIEKLIRRHPHVFDNVSVKNAQEVVDNWEKIKQTEKNMHTKSYLSGVPRVMPSLLRAQCIQDKVSRVGFDWQDWSGTWEKIGEECQELHEAILLNNKEKIVEELGDLIFSCVNLSRSLGITAEDALDRATSKFIVRFQHLEQAVKNQNKSLESLTLEQMDKLWDEIKQQEFSQDNGRDNAE